MTDERFANELSHLLRVRDLLRYDVVLPLRLDIERRSLDHRRFGVTLRGIPSLIANPARSSAPTAPAFQVAFEVPRSGYPFTSKPQIQFETPVPFHPHVWTSGAICWGSEDRPRPDLVLVDWLRGVIEYLQYSDGEQGVLTINRDSPANSEARDWWVANRGAVRRHIPAIDLARLRLLIDRSRG